MVTNSADTAEQPTEGKTEVILGVDTHNDVHVPAVITTLGVLLGTTAFRPRVVNSRQSWP